MYKTIRHGENSLQYTILPQNDDFRIEGKLSCAESSCSSSSGPGSGSVAARNPKGKRPRRRSFFAYLGLIFVCTVIVGAILIPFLVSAECLPNPSEWFLKTKAAFTRRGSPAVTATGTGSIHPLHGGKSHGDTGEDASLKGKLIESIEKLGDPNSALLSGNRSRMENIDAERNSQVYREMSNTSNIYNVTATNTMAVSETGNTGMQQSETVSQNPPESETIGSQPQTSKEALVVLDENLRPGNVAAEQHFESGHNNTSTLLSSSPASGSSALPPQLTAFVATNAASPLHSNDTLLTPKTLLPPIIRPTSSLTAANINSPRLLASNNFGAQAAATPSLPTIMTRIIQVPLLKSAAKKPIIPSILAKTNAQLTPSLLDEGFEGAAIQKQATLLSSSSAHENSNPGNSNSNWIHTHWPYIDPSTYFQWTGYKSEDSVLLPALLGFALIGMILIIAICLVARNKRRIVSSVRKRNRNDIEETGAEDNATLLTSTNLSDED